MESHVEDLRSGLTGRGHDVVAVCGRGGVQRGGTSTITSRAVAGADLFSPEPLDRDALRALVDSVRSRFRPDVLHVHNPNHFDPAIADAVLDSAFAGRRVASVHDRPVAPSCNEALTRPWDHVLFASHYLKGALPCPEASSVLHLGIDLRVFRPGVEAHPDLATCERPVVFHPARLLRWKGVLDSAEAFLAVRRTLGRGTLVLVASQDTLSDPEHIRTLRAEVVDLFAGAGCPGAVAFVDFDRSEMPAAYAGSDVVWYPTRAEEPYGLVPLEAMACGRPVVVTASGGMRETVVDGQGALVVARGDVHGLAERTIELLRDPSRAADLSARGVRHVVAASLDAYLDRLEQVYSGDV